MSLITLQITNKQYHKGINVLNTLTIKFDLLNKINTD